MLPHWGNHAYVNYADPTITDYRHAYFGANAARLAQVRAAYDPHGFFTQPQDY
jgi:FAD/FMN-containing dehydrogenase